MHNSKANLQYVVVTNYDLFIKLNIIIQLDIAGLIGMYYAAK
ncbi:hypothetical protein P20480_1126 [Pseudoalteromonas sp. BSi20480]|nr:hypothetical protein P20480_1126 [Pseudoalteromonas sp. BSi20480]